MSTQRRENHSTPATKTNRPGPRKLWQRRSCTERRGGSEQIWLIFLAWFARAIAMVGTAPRRSINLLTAACFHPIDEDLSLGAPEALATNSLQTDYRSTQFVRFVRLAREGIRLGSHSSPSPITGERTDKGIPATLRSSLLEVPSPSGFARLSPALP